MLKNDLIVSMILSGAIQNFSYSSKKKMILSGAVVFLL